MEKIEPIHPKHLAIFRNVILMQSLIESIDELKSTPFYRQSIKNRCNSLQQDLLKHIGDLSSEFYMNDEELMLNVSRGIDIVTHAFSTMHPAQYCVLESIFAKLNEAFEQTIKENENETHDTGND